MGLWTTGPELPQPWPITTWTTAGPAGHVLAEFLGAAQPGHPEPERRRLNEVHVIRVEDRLTRQVPRRAGGAREPEPGPDPFHPRRAHPTGELGGQRVALARHRAPGQSHHPTSDRAHPHRFAELTPIPAFLHPFMNPRVLP